MLENMHHCSDVITREAKDGRRKRVQRWRKRRWNRRKRITIILLLQLTFIEHLQGARNTLSPLFAFLQISWHLITHRRTSLLHMNIFMAQHMLFAFLLHIYGILTELCGYISLIYMMTFKCFRSRGELLWPHEIQLTQSSSYYTN